MMKGWQRIKKLNEITEHKYWELAEYILNCMSLAAGLGSMWRFPYTTYLHDGGSFVLPYIILYFLVGLPMVVLNFGLGQFSGLATTKLWTNLGPGWTGIGVTQCILAMVCLFYYGFHSALTLRYACNAWRSKFDWGECDASAIAKKNCLPLYREGTHDANIKYNHNLSSSAELYLAMHLLHTEVEFDRVELGPPNFELCFYLAIVWICIYLYTSIGINRYTKVAFFTGSLPYLTIIVFFVHATLLPGSGKAIKSLFVPKIKQLFSVDNWIAALMQCYFTFNISCGALTVFSANASFDHNISRTIGIVFGCDLLLSMLAGISVFSCLGYLAHLQKVELEDVIKTNRFWSPYIAYSTGLIYIRPLTSVFAFVFFFTIFMGTLFEMSSLLQILIMNLYEWTNWFRKTYLLTALSLICAAFSIACSTPEGTVLATFADLYGNLYCRAILVPLQIIAVCYTYGLKNWCWDVEYMLGKPVSYYYRWAWAVWVPAILVIIYCGSIVSQAADIYNLGLLPYKIRIFCFLFLGFSTLPIPIILLYHFFTNCDSGWKVSLSRAFNYDLWWPQEPEFSDPMLRFRATKLLDEEWDMKIHPRTAFAQFFRPLTAKVP